MNADKMVETMLRCNPTEAVYAVVEAVAAKHNVQPTEASEAFLEAITAVRPDLAVAVDAE